MPLSRTFIETKNNLLDLVKVYRECIEEYQAYTSGLNARGFHPILSISVAAVIAYFDLNGCQLASELLAHARDNDMIDSYYQPVLGWETSRSSLTDEIRISSAVSGSGNFERGSGEYDDDLYYAIHSFNWYKDTSRLRISDRYDYDRPAVAEGLAGLAIGQMKAAQDAGVIIPFYTLIYIPL